MSEPALLVIDVQQGMDNPRLGKRNNPDAEKRIADVIAAWSVFSQRGRAAFRDALDVDDGTWSRARGYALHQAVLIIPYYAQTNLLFVALAKRTVEEVLAENV